MSVEYKEHLFKKKAWLAMGMAMVEKLEKRGSKWPVWRKK